MEPTLADKLSVAWWQAGRKPLRFAVCNCHRCICLLQLISASARRNEVHTITRFRALSMRVSRGLGWVHVMSGKVSFDPS